MKRLLLLLISGLLLCSFDFPQQVFYGQIGSIGYHADSTFVWECTSTTAEYARNSGDTTAGTANTPSISGGWCLFPDADRYFFSVSSDDLVDDEQGTVFVKFHIPTGYGHVGNLSIFTAYADANNRIKTLISGGSPSSAEMSLEHIDNGTARTVTTSSSGYSLDTDYYLRARWDVSRTAADIEVDVFSDAALTTEVMGSTAEDDSGALNTAIGYFIFGNYATGGGFKADYVHIYGSWRDDDPNAN